MATNKINPQDINVSKPMFSVHISNDLTLFERKIMNTLIKRMHNIEYSLNNSFKHTTPHGNYYEITFDEIEKLLNLDQYHQRRDIIKALHKLVNTTLEFNTLRRDNKRFKDIVFAPLLAGVKFADDFLQKDDNEDNKVEKSNIYFTFSPFLSEALLDPIPYANLSFTEQNKIKSKHSLALLELLQCELNTQGKDEVLSQILPVKKYEDLVAGRESNYEFKYIKQELIKKPLQEINSKTNIRANSIVHKNGRSVNGIQFLIKKENNDNNLPLFEIQKSEINKVNIDNTNIIDYTSMNKIKVIKKQLIEIGISLKKTNEILKECNLNLIEANITYLDNQSSYKNKITPALLISAIKNNYSNYNEFDLKLEQEGLSKLDFKNNLMQEEALNNTIYLDNIKNEIEKPKNSKINEILIKEKISEIKRKEFVLKYSDNHILENIEEAKSFAIKRKTEVSAPLIIKAIEENWSNSGLEKEKMKEKQDLIEKLRTLIYSYNGVSKGVRPAPSKYIAQNIYFYKLFQNKEFAEEYKVKHIKSEDREVAFHNEFEGCKQYLANQFKEMDLMISTLNSNHGYDFMEFLNDNSLTEDKIYNLMELTREEFLKIKQEVL